MVGSSETRTLCPSISFLFAHLGASLSASRNFYPLVEGFVFRGSSLGVVLADLVPLLRQSVDWFEDLVGERRGMLEVRSSELEMVRVRVRRPRKEKRAYHFSPREVCLYEATFLCGLRFPVHPFIMELLNHFKIAFVQLVPNSWRIVISCMEIWLATTEGDMIRVDEFIYLYHLKESKEYRYYELVPWVREARIVRGLPSSF